MAVEFVQYDEDFNVDPITYALSAQQDRVVVALIGGYSGGGVAAPPTSVEIDNGGAVFEMDAVIDINSGGVECNTHPSMWKYKIPADWAGNVTINPIGYVAGIHDYIVELKNASGEVGSSASDTTINTLTVPNTLVSSLILDLFTKDGNNLPASDQTLIDSFNHNSLDDREDHCQLTSYSGGGGNIVMGYASTQNPSAIIAAEFLAAPPAYTTRPVEYFLDAWDPEQKIKDARGNVVPRWKIKPNKWCYIAGLGGVTAEIYPNFYENDNLVYFESVRYDGETDKVQIITNKGSLPEVMMARLQLGSAG
jgi:hypothetical protein